MQPYFFPYIGYFQLINYVDTFVIYDQLKYTKKGWINRNFILNKEKEQRITLPLRSGSDNLNIDQRLIVEDKGFKKIINQLKNNYSGSRDFKEKIEIINNIYEFQDYNLFNFLDNSIKVLENYFFQTNKIIKYSSLNISKDLKGQDRIIAICKNLEATEYINPIGGLKLYSKEVFSKNNIGLYFLKTQIELNNNSLETDRPVYPSILHYLMMLDKNDLSYKLKNEFRII
jgi:hypothetical protein